MMYKSKPPWIKKAKPLKIKNTSKSRSNYKLYNSHAWRKVSKESRIKDPICRMCGKIHHDYKGLVLDHIIPVNQKGSIWDKRNHQCLCKHPCHDIKSGKDQKKYSGPFKVLENGRKIPI